MDFIIVNDNDNVATALRDCKSGEILGEIILIDSISNGHKFAIKHIAFGEIVVKYGQPIGKASCDIPVGSHVHVHNIEGIRGRGDLT